MQPGIYRDLSNEDYHGGEGDSKSGLDLIHKTPAAFIAKKQDPEGHKSTPSQELGTAFHMLVLEPALFVQTYCLALRMQDVPGAVDDRDVLVAMVEELNSTRRPKLPVSGSKADLIDRIVEHCNAPGRVAYAFADLEGMTGVVLKSILEKENQSREGMLSLSGSRHDLAALLRSHGVEVTLWSDVYAEWMANNSSRRVLSPETFEQLQNMAAAVAAHPSASKLLAAPGEAELSAYWFEPVIDPLSNEVIDEILCRCRPDFWRKDGIIVDLKSTKDEGASQEEFARSIANYRYHVQHAMYLDGAAKALAQAKGFEDYARPTAFVFIAVENTACVVNGKSKGVAVYALDRDSVNLGRLEQLSDLLTLSECRRSNEWPGYSDRIEPIALPGYHFTKAAAKLATGSP